LPTCWWNARTGRWALFGAGAAALVAAAFALDDAAVRLAAEPIRSGQARTTLVALRFFGDGAPLVLLTLLAFAAAPTKRRPATLALLAALLSGLVVDRGKTLTDRKRPIETLPASASESWNIPDEDGRNSSFPSGHAATAFGFARGMSLAFPPVAPVAYLAACGTAISRMHELRHYLSDCVVGALVGWSMASFLWWAAIWSAARREPGDESAPPDVLPLSRSA
jgi:membrane-associated phospholipid phosphatase